MHYDKIGYRSGYLPLAEEVLYKEIPSLDRAGSCVNLIFYGDDCLICCDVNVLIGSANT